MVRAKGTRQRFLNRREVPLERARCLTRQAGMKDIAGMPQLLESGEEFIERGGQTPSPDSREQDLLG
jgi:hypothetical protein